MLVVSCEDIQLGLVISNSLIIKVTLRFLFKY